MIDYGAAKAALLNVAKALSQELGPMGIRINSISPGPVATDLWLGEHGVAATVGAATGLDPRPSASKRSQACRPAASPPPKKSQRWWRCSPRRAPGTSPAPTM